MACFVPFIATSYCYTYAGYGNILLLCKSVFIFYSENLPVVVKTVRVKIQCHWRDGRHANKPYVAKLHVYILVTGDEVMPRGRDICCIKSLTTVSGLIAPVSASSPCVAYVYCVQWRS